MNLESVKTSQIFSQLFIIFIFVAKQLVIILLFKSSHKGSLAYTEIIQNEFSTFLFYEFHVSLKAS